MARIHQTKRRNYGDHSNPLPNTLPKPREQGPSNTRRRSSRRAAQVMPGFYNETALARRAREKTNAVPIRVEKEKKDVMVSKVQVCKPGPNWTGWKRLPKHDNPWISSEG